MSVYCICVSRYVDRLLVRVRTSLITRPRYSFRGASVKSVISPKLSGLPASRVAFVYPTISCCSIAQTSRPAAAYWVKISCEPRRPPSSAAYQWNSMVFWSLLGPKSLSESRTRRASRIVNEPEALSSTPGARPVRRLAEFMESR
jgi:hypothetical protein